MTDFSLAYMKEDWWQPAPYSPLYGGTVDNLQASQAGSPLVFPQDNPRGCTVRCPSLLPPTLTLSVLEVQQVSFRPRVLLVRSLLLGSRLAADLCESSANSYPKSSVRGGC